MSFHTVTMMTRWALLGTPEKNDLLDELKRIPFHTRKLDPRVIQIVKNFKNIWSNGNKIERLAVLGWQESESISIFCSMIDSIDELRKQYKEECQRHGSPSELNDTNLSQYEKAVQTEIRVMKK
jgi:hypothetical protein